MKNKEQIKKYLRKQEWYHKFIDNTRKFNDTPLVIKKVKNGEYYENTILKAFEWRLTNDGKEYWCKIDNEFRMWYISE